MLVIVFLVGFSALVLRGLLLPAAHWGDSRAAVLRQIARRPKPVVVFVSYPSPGWHLEQEWESNSYEIDTQRVVLAHNISAERNVALIRYYADREPLALTVTDGSAVLTPYGESAPAEHFPIVVK